MMIFSNPIGWWALLGIPAVLAIHFLQRQSKTVPISTRFLLENAKREAASGHRFERLTNSVPLWMQILAVLLITWILLAPRYQREQSTQRVAVVLDGSASMEVFKETLKNELTSILPDLQGPAAILEVTLLDSGKNAQRIYSGQSYEDALNSLDEWEPDAGVNDPTPSLRVARSVVGREGVVIYATDTVKNYLPFDARLLSVGEPVENVGLTGIRFEKDGSTRIWTAVIRNYSDSPASRTWSVIYEDGSQTEPRNVDIAPGAMVSIKADFPEDHQRGIIKLSSDRFTIDDSMPMVPPVYKHVAVRAQTPELDQLAEGMSRSLESVSLIGKDDSAMIRLIAKNPNESSLPQDNAIVFSRSQDTPGSLIKGDIIAEPHPLVKDLQWETLSARETPALEQLPTDDVLLWQGTRPMIFLRELSGENGAVESWQLFFNFSLKQSNALRQPAFIVCIHRFTEMIRDNHVAPAKQNLETGQPITIACHNMPNTPIDLSESSIRDNSTEKQELGATTRLSLKAPTKPGFIKVDQGEINLLDAAVYFADIREADFSRCSSENKAYDATEGIIEKHTDEDRWWQLWILLLLLALLLSWFFATRVPNVKTATQGS